MRPDSPCAAKRKSASGTPVLMYESAVKIQPRRVKGRFANLRVIAMIVLLGPYYLLPWLSWNGHPAVFFDLPHRRFHILALTLVPQDLLLLALLLLLAALTLFLFTSLAGRLWCGYACPQTVWTEAFLFMEEWCEGNRYKRIGLDRSPWTREKLLRRGSKHALWGLFSLFTGLSFVAYFVPARELFPAALNLQLSGWSLFWVLFYGFATWGNAGFMREQVCKYMCPYARFQSAMFDRDTLIIAYNEPRAEPRKLIAKKTGEKAGDCVDCSLCVQACPVGIDIRQGLQYECIACAACIDACDSVMDAIGRPRGLIRYTSSNHDVSGRFRLLRPRTIGYGAVWLAACGGFIALLATHSPIRFDVLRDRHTLYRELASGAIENVYVVKLTNSDAAAHRYRLSARFEDGTVLSVEPQELERAAQETRATTITLRTPADGLRGSDDENGDEGHDEHEDEHRNERGPQIEHVVIKLEQTDAPQLTTHRNARFLTGGRS